MIRIVEILSLSVLVSALGILEAEELSLRGSSRSEYWVYRGDYDEHFENRLEIDLFYRGFVAKAGYFMWEPSQRGVSIRYPIFSLGYSASPVSIEVGHYYATFGKGLILREYLDKDFKHDKSLIGLKVTADFSPVSVTLLSGRPRNLLFRGESFTYCSGVAARRVTADRFVYEFANDTTDLLRGADLTLTLNRRITFGGTYLRLAAESDSEPSAFTELIGGNLGYSIGDWDSYFEYAQQLTCSAARGRIRGEGIYFSLSGGLVGIGLTAEYTDYRDLALGGSDYRYNDPPTPLRNGLSINRGLDERGGSTMISTSLSPSLYVEAEYGFLESHNRSQWAGEWYADLKYDVTDVLSLSLGVDRSHEKEIEPDIVKLDTRPRFGVVYYLSCGDGIEFGFSHGFVEELENSKNTDYAESSLSVSYSRSSFFSVGVRAEHRSKQIKRLSPETFWLFTEVTADLRPNLSLRILAGSMMGGMVCSGGVCRFEPDFEGVKATLSYIF